MQNILRYTDDQLYRIEASAEGQIDKKKSFWIILRVKISSTGSGDGSYTDNSSDENRDEKKWKRIPMYYHLYIDDISNRNDLTNHHFDQYAYTQKHAALISLLVSD